MTLIPAKTKTPVSKTSTERLKLALQQYQTENKFLKEKIDELQSEIKRSSMEVSAELGNNMVTIMPGVDQSKISLFTKIFWEEQQKCVKLTAAGFKYHPMIISYCLSLAVKSCGALRFDKKRYWFLHSLKSSSPAKLQKLHQTRTRS